MPQRPYRACSTSGCPNITRSAACEICTRKRQAQRGSAHQRGYNDADHEAWRQAVKLASNGLCVSCLAVGRTVMGRVADHIVPRANGGAQYDPDNGQWLCDGVTNPGASCHDRKRNAERRGRQMMVIDGRGLMEVGPLPEGGGQKFSAAPRGTVGRPPRAAREIGNRGMGGL